MLKMTMALTTCSLWAYFAVEKNVLLDPIQLNPSSFIGIPFQVQGIAGSIEKFSGFWVQFY